MTVHRRLAAAGVAAALALALGGCSSAAAPGPAAGTFVGEVADPAVSVAVVAGQAAAGQTEREVKVVVYGDSLPLIQEFFEGAAAGNNLDLASETGARLTGSLAADAASGKVTLADGRTFDFQAAPATTGGAGWYSFTGLTDKVTGTSTEGGKLEAAFSPALAGPGMYKLAGTVTRPGGSPTPFEVPFVVPEKPSQPVEQVAFALIVAPDGTVRGGAKPKRGSSGGSGFHCLFID